MVKMVYTVVVVLVMMITMTTLSMLSMLAMLAITMAILVLMITMTMLVMMITTTMAMLATITTLSNLARKSASIESTSSSSKQIGASDPPNLMKYRRRKYRLFFFNWASPEFAKCWNYIQFARHLDVF